MRHEHVEQFEHFGCTVTIDYDLDPESPRDWDNLGTMVCWHKRHTLGDKHEFDSPTEFQEFVKVNPGIIVLPLYLYDHGGITMSTGTFSCPYDSGQVGYIYILPDKVREEYSAKRISRKLRERVEGYLRNEVNTYDQFLTGQVYGYTVEDESRGIDDSCWGFFGLDYCVTEAKSVAEHESKRLDAENAKIAAMLPEVWV